MTAAEIASLQSSFRKVTPIADQAAALFYARLFELDPSLRRLFRGDMKAQRRKLMQLIASTIDSLDRLDVLRPALRRLGARQALHGARDEHYAFAGKAMLWALEKGLGPEFTPMVKGAWTRLFTVLANTMLDGAHLHPKAA